MVPLDSSRLLSTKEVPEGPGDTELSKIFHSTQEARADAATGDISATGRLVNTRQRSITPKPFEKSQDTSEEASRPKTVGIDRIKQAA